MQSGQWNRTRSQVILYKRAYGRVAHVNNTAELHRPRVHASRPLVRFLCVEGARGRDKTDRHWVHSQRLSLASTSRVIHKHSKQTGAIRRVIVHR